MPSMADPPGPLAGLTDSAQQVAVHVLTDRMKPNICDTRVPTENTHRYELLNTRQSKMTMRRRDQYIYIYV